MPTQTSAEENKANIRRVIEGLYSRGDLSVAEELYAANYIRHDPATPNVGTGVNAVKQVANTYRTAFPDLELTVEDIVAEGDKVLCRWSAHGTHLGELQGAAPTGKRFEITGLTLMQFADGQIVEEWANWDVLGMLQQLGVSA
ncbi:MAG: ester cyclase [Blastocatellia bacterium]